MPNQTDIQNLHSPAAVLKQIASSPNALVTPWPDFTNGNFYAIIFSLLLNAMSIRQDTVMNQAKQITANASIQNLLNARNGKITFAILPPNATQAEINRVQDLNQQYSALREDIQNSLITARQNAQVLMTQAETNVNLLQTNATEDTGVIQNQNDSAKAILQMNQ